MAFKMKGPSLMKMVKESAMKLAQKEGAMKLAQKSPMKDETLESIQKSKKESGDRLKLIGVNPSEMSDFTPDQQVELQKLARKVQSGAGGGMNEAAINAAKSKILNPTRKTGEN